MHTYIHMLKVLQSNLHILIIVCTFLSYDCLIKSKQRSTDLFHIRFYMYACMKYKGKSYRIVNLCAAETSKTC